MRSNTCARKPGNPTRLDISDKLEVQLDLTDSDVAEGATIVLSLEDSSRSVVLSTREHELLAAPSKSSRFSLALPAQDSLLRSGAALIVRAAIVSAAGAVQQECADVTFNQPAPAPASAPAQPVAVAEQQPALLIQPLSGVPVLGGPLHASCKLTWTFANQQCANVSRALVAAAQSMSGSDCGTGEKCLYSLTSFSDTAIKGVHETPKAHYKDDLSFTLTQNADTCIVGGYSSSQTWYAVLDSGTNYCNLHNLVTAQSLPFTEQVSESDCTQLTSADCEKY